MTDGLSGKDFLVQLFNGTDYVTIAGMRSTKFSVTMPPAVPHWCGMSMLWYSRRPRWWHKP